MKSILIALLATITLNTSAFAAFTCEKDNKITLPTGSYCCCSLNTSTPAEKDYICTIKTAKCTSKEIPVGMKDKDETGVCPCKLALQ